MKLICSQNGQIVKVENGTFKHFILVGLIALTSTSESFGQVITRVLSPEDKIENYIPWYNPDEEIPIVNAPFVDVEAVLQEDQQTGREMPRIGIKQEVDFSSEDGKLIQRGNYTHWNMTLFSENAKSLSIRFDNTYLPKNAIMFLYNEESKFLIGPIGQEVFQNGVFRSDYLNGDHVTINIFLPNNIESEELDINVYSYDHGIKSFKSYDDDFESSGDCNNNVACVNGWGCQSEAVCKIIHSSIGSCTGTLVNNDCCDLTPFILTADHCTSGNPVDDYVFRFNYQSPQCDPNGETTPSQWVVYFGSELKANWNRSTGTDFALLELQSELNSNNSPSFAGWDRFNSNTSNSACIHHPSGDVKKISFDDDPNTLNGNYHRIIWDDGTTEPGSSGSPLFNDNNRIIGQLWGGTASCTNSNGWDEYGRLDLSWEGNGTNTTRLRNWLGSSTNPNTLDCMDHPFVTGLDVLCTTPLTFSLINNMPCVRDVQWEVNASNLLASPSSGSGNSATLWAKPNVKGPATITFILTSNGCDPIELEKDFWIGAPQALTTYPDPTICFGQFEQFIIPESYGASNYHLQSLSPHLWISTNNPTPYFPIDIIGNQVGIYKLQLTVTNECGSSTATIYVTVERCGGDDNGGFELRNVSADSVQSNYNLMVFPNPTNDLVHVSCENCTPDTNMKVSVLSTNGRVIQLTSFDSTTAIIDLTQLISGFYILKVDIEGQTYHQKIIKV